MATPTAASADADDPTDDSLRDHSLNLSDLSKSWARKQHEGAVLQACRRAFDTLQNVPDKSEVRGNTFKLDKAVRNMYLLRFDVFATCAGLIADLEKDCSLFELELPKHIAALKDLGACLEEYGEGLRKRRRREFARHLEGS